MKKPHFSSTGTKALGLSALTVSRAKYAVIAFACFAFLRFIVINGYGSAFLQRAGLLPSAAVDEASTENAHGQLPGWIEWHRPGLSKRPDWCEQLETEPRSRPYKPIRGECGRRGNDVLCADGKPMFFGWKNEDLYTWNRHFRHLRRPGVFLDVAANDPVSRSNTFFYEQCLGWRGVCVEANPAYFRPLRTRRTCALVKRCVSDRRHTVVFADLGGIGGVMETNKNRLDMKKLLQRTRTTECIRTAIALAELGETTIDFMSLDVEGHELHVLKGIDWRATKINLIVTESRSRELQAFLEQHDFGLHEVENQDAFDALRGDRLFIHKRVTWGSPV